MTCTVCRTPIALPHCDSKNCTWCRGCYERKLDECKKP